VVGLGSRWKLGWVLVVFRIASSTEAEEQNRFVFWDTVSPNGKYALAWTKTGSVALDDMPSPDSDNDSVQNWLMDLDSRKLTILLPDARYWVLDGSRPNHFSMDTVWSDDSSSLLLMVESKWATEQFIIVDTKNLRARGLAKSMRRAFIQVLRRDGGALFKRHAEQYMFTFSAPWFVGRNRFNVYANASIPKATEGDFNYYLTFDCDSNQVTLEKSSVCGPETSESGDRELNHVYRSLIGLLKPAERQALVQEERTWIAERDSAKGSQAKEELVRKRIEELAKRRDDRVNELNAAQRQ
jgi:uncharacterized protein YecT (DUF1311 family)